MSVLYCPDHDRHVDLDYGPCPECEQAEVELEEVQEEAAEWNALVDASLARKVKKL